MTDQEPMEAEYISNEFYYKPHARIKQFITDLIVAFIIVGVVALVLWIASITG